MDFFLDRGSDESPRNTNSSPNPERTNCQTIVETTTTLNLLVASAKKIGSNSCILTANAILSQKTSPAIATVEKGAEAVMIPADTFRDWVMRYDLWREFVFDLLSQRLSTIMAIVDEIAFRRMDARIAALSLARAQTQTQYESLTRRLRQSWEVHVR
jgi:hypothetical protein